MELNNLDVVDNMQGESVDLTRKQRIVDYTSKNWDKYVFTFVIFVQRFIAV